MLDSDTKLRLGALVAFRSAFTAWQVECDLGLLRELFGEMLEKLQ